MSRFIVVLPFPKVFTTYSLQFTTIQIFLIKLYHIIKLHHPKYSHYICYKNHLINHFLEQQEPPSKDAEVFENANLEAVSS